MLGDRLTAPNKCFALNGVNRTGTGAKSRINLGDRLTVGHIPLKDGIMVRIHVPQICAGKPNHGSLSAFGGESMTPLASSSAVLTLGER